MSGLSNSWWQDGVVGENQRMSRDHQQYVAAAFGRLFVASLLIIGLLWGIHAVNDGAAYDVAKIIAALVLLVLTALTFKKVLARFESPMSKDDNSGS